MASRARAHRWLGDSLVGTSAPSKSEIHRIMRVGRDLKVSVIVISACISLNAQVALRKPFGRKHHQQGATEGAAGPGVCEDRRRQLALVSYVASVGKRQPSRKGTEKNGQRRSTCMFGALGPDPALLRAQGADVIY